MENYTDNLGMPVNAFLYLIKTPATGNLLVKTRKKEHPKNKAA